MKHIASLLVTVVLALGALPAHAAGDQKHPQQIDWAFDGVFGTVDRAAAQRGLQVYKEVCAACHGLKRVAFRNLMDLGFSEGEVKTIAADASVIDGPNDEGEMFERPGLPSDRFVPPYPNEKAARASNGGAYPPDLSLIVKARQDGANYLYSLLVGYEEAPEGQEPAPGQYYNPYFPGGFLAMPPPLSNDLVTYQDGTNASVEQMAKDLTVFLQWAAEPEMELRKRMGIKVLVFLAIMTVLFYIAKKRLWKDVHIAKGASKGKKA
jgi:ubiquinol-cytochrome c reductase cytochrome c1 subunit